MFPLADNLFPNGLALSPDNRGFAPIAGRVSNCAFGPGRYLYVTNDTQVVRGRIRTDFPGRSPIQS
jgi:sugar lactone lactonase YvrE